jgi:DNA polymerase-3 subunit delta'
MTWDLIGHEWAADLLSRHVASGQVRHAYLLTGPDGVGKRALALRFVQALFCAQPPEPGGRCGECTPCRQVATQRFPDLHEVARAENETLLGIDAIRGLRRQLALSSFGGGWRAALLTGFQDTTIEAQNALLKTLEEPAPKVVLILLALQPDLLLPTIVSRCEALTLRPVPAGVIAAALQARGETAERARLLAALSGGRPGVALRLAADREALTMRAKLVDDLRMLLGASRVTQFAFVEGLAGRRRELDLEAKRREAVSVLQAWLSLWRDAMLVASGAEVALANPDWAEEARRLADGLGLERARRAVEAMDRTIDAVRKNANLQLALETLFLDLPRIPNS